MAELGDTNDPRALIPGDTAALHDVADSLGSYGEVLHQAGAGLRRIDTSAGWSGQAAEQFRSVFHGQPGKWLTAGDAFHAARTAVQDYTSSLAWAQGQASDAIAQWNEAQAATAQATTQHAQAVTQAQRQAEATSVAGTPATPVNIPFTDPGEAKREAARQTLNRARSQLASAGDTRRDGGRQSTR
ncbi:MAG: putative T7SS-secreted protein [Sciscionella sp.]